MTIIAFISQKGGVGKSTLAQALASEAKKQKTCQYFGRQKHKHLNCNELKTATPVHLASQLLQ